MAGRSADVGTGGNIHRRIHMKKLQTALQVSLVMAVGIIFYKWE
jgi:hypothetical protein